MIFLKNILLNIKRYSLFFLFLLIIPLVISLINLTGVISPKISQIMLFILISLYYLITGMHMGKHSVKCGYINGLINGFIIISIHLILSLFISSNFKITLIYLLILYILIIFGNMLGATKKGNTSH